MKLLPLVIFAVLITSPVFSQERKVFKVNPGQKVVEGIPYKDLYKYGSFLPGEVNFRNGRVGSARMNYNNLYGEIQFIDPKGDTLSLSDELTISYITLLKDTFFYDKEFVDLIGTYGRIRLGRKNLIGYVKREKLDGYGQKSSASIETYSTVSNGQYMKDLVAKEVLTFAPYTVYYFGDIYNHFKIANKKNLVSMFAKFEDQIQAFLKQENIDFKNEHDLLKLAQFIQQL